MKPATLYSTVLVCALCAGCDAPLSGDPARGAQLHEACLGCHGAELYVSPNAKVRTLSELRKEVENWNDRMNPEFDKQEVADITAYLNSTYYKFQ
ncbi:MAG: c-type cytochrome [Burkholderiales bacterium]